VQIGGNTFKCFREPEKNAVEYKYVKVWLLLDSALIFQISLITTKIYVIKRQKHMRKYTPPAIHCSYTGPPVTDANNTKGKEVTLHTWTMAWPVINLYVLVEGFRQ
jgi:hypothetical protein